MSTTKEKINDLLKRPMSRQQFLKQVGLVVLAAVGITNLLNAFDHQRSKTVSSDGDMPPYGASVYAGGKKPV